MSEMDRPESDASDDEILAWLRREYAQPLVGWDFSYLEGRRLTVTDKPWDLDSIVLPALRSSNAVLDEDTGGGEHFSKLLFEASFEGRAFATEGYAPNVSSARRRLEPHGARVVEVRDPSAMPFSDGSFDLILNRHGSCTFTEEHRVLGPGGAFVIQQVGEQTNREILELFDQPWPPRMRETHDFGNLDRAKDAAVGAGFRVEMADEAMSIRRFVDAGALSYYMKCIPWTVEDFSVDRYADTLIRLHRELSKADAAGFDVRFHSYFLKLRKE